MRISLAFAWGCVAAAALYSLLRILQAVSLEEPNPALVFLTEHTGYFWRAWTVAYAAGMVAFLAFLAAGRDVERTARVLGRALTPVGILVVVQAMFVP